MAEPIFLGQATVHGIDGTLAYTGVATTDNIIDSVNFVDGVKEQEVLDGKGEVVGLKLWQKKRTITIKFYPSEPAAAGAVATAKTNAVLPAIGSKVAIAAMPPVVGTADSAVINSAKWIYAGGGSYDFTREGDLVMTLPLRLYTNDLATTTN
jgi:hypothetical protein